MSYDLYHTTSSNISKLITRSYSTSFSIAVSTLQPKIRADIYNIYGFVRLADEIVDTFQEHRKAELLYRFEAQFYQAYYEGISLNPVLHAFVRTVKKYDISLDLVDDFIESMKMDLGKVLYSKKNYDKYIHGSANVVGLMCLYVFVEGDLEKYEKLKKPAMMLGSAFQKVNFLRDLKDDIHLLDRQYFPGFNSNNFSDEIKKQIVAEIENEFADAFQGVKRLPVNSRLAVYIAYKYYRLLLRKLKRTSSKKILTQRVRVPNYQKMVVLADSFIRHKVNII
ncbi:MAG: phytoene/squalene synthase family protein [Bacteroidales bacterium]|nr:phytoene/squalene synthase family protein [Bacteroidales bacterium]